MAWSGRGLTLLVAVAFLQITFVSSHDKEVSLLPRKCCPKNQFLNATSSSCVVLSDIEESSLELLHRDKLIQIGFPEKCEDYNIVPISSSKSYDYNNVCIDKTIDFKVVTVSCLQTGSVRQNINVLNFRKCCPLGFAYNKTEHMCRKYDKYGIVERFHKKLNNYYVNFKYGLKTCVQDKAVLTYVLKDSNNYSVDLKGTLRISYGNFLDGQFCVDYGIDGDVIARVCKNNVEELCEKNTCIRKCCPEGHTYQKPGRKSQCLPSELGFVPHFQHIVNDTEDLEDVAYSGNAAIIINFTCPAGRYRLNVHRYPETDVHYITSKGVLHFLNDDVREKQLQSIFCIENIENINNENGLNTFVCFPVEQTEERFKWYRIAYLISCVFFVLTFSVYCCLPELQNLYGKTLMCYVLSLLFAYICVSAAQFIKFGALCKVIGFLIIFTFFAAFCWLNIMCFDIWMTFGGTQNVKGLHMEKKNLKRFLLYSLYGWGVPCLLTLNMFLIDFTDILPDTLKPFVGTYRCLYAKKESYGGLIFFLGPIVVQSVCNLVLFVLTAYHCSRVKAEIHRLQMGSQGERRKSKFLADKAKFMMNLKLFLVMGISWIHEVFSTLFPEPQWLWYPGDFFNMLLGIPIFCIFVLKPKVWKLLLQRVGIKKKLGTGNGTGVSTSSSTLKNKKFSTTSNTFTSSITTNQKSLN